MEKKEGEVIIWHPNGQINLLETYKENILHGLWTRWTKEGVKIEEKHYLEGKEEGETY